MGISWTRQRNSYHRSSPVDSRCHDKKLDKSRNPYLKQRQEAWLTGLPVEVAVNAPHNIPAFISIGGGKGGVGKSLLSANIAAKLGQAGFKLLLVDLDLGSANLHTYFGLGMPKQSLTDFIVHDHSSFNDVLVPTPISGVSLLAGGKGESWSNVIDQDGQILLKLWNALLHSKESNQIDFVVLDLGAGSHKHTIDFFAAAHMGIVTVLPEPTSIENAYSFLKSAIWKLIENSGLHLDHINEANEVKNLLFSPGGFTRGSYLIKLENLRSRYPELIDFIFKNITSRQIGFVVNQIRSQKDIDIGLSMEAVTKSYFGFQTNFLGYMNYDDAAWKSLRNRRLLVMDFPHCILTKRLNEVSNNIMTSLGY